MPETKIATTATLRPFGCELSTLSQADGSAIWKSGGTSVLASVHGPAAPRQAALEQPNAQVSLIVAGQTSSSENNMSTDQTEWEPLLRNVLDRCIHVAQYPRCVIQVVCHVLSNDGSVLAACLHASVAALMDAGIAMRQLPTAVALRVLPVDNDHDNHHGYHLSLDPNMEQEQDMDRSPLETPCALLCIILAESSSSSSPSSSNNNSNTNNDMVILATHTRGGPAPIEIWPMATSLAERARPALTNFMKMALQQKMKARNKTDA